MKLLKKLMDTLGRILWYGALVLIGVTLINVALARYNGQIPSIGGYSLFRIATGSMEPTIPTGTYILVRKTPPEQLKTGDIITYYSEDPAIQGFPNTHRIVDILRDRDRHLAFVTRGDYNMKDDELPVDQEQIIGRYVRNMVRLTEFVEFFMQESVLAIMLLLQAVCAVVMHLYTRKLKKQAAAEQQQAEVTLEEKKRALIDAEIARLKARDASEHEQEPSEDGQEASGNEQEASGNEEETQ